jgi:hypothetical protein
VQRAQRLTFTRLEAGIGIASVIYQNAMSPLVASKRRPASQRPGVNAGHNSKRKSGNPSSCPF